MGSVLRRQEHNAVISERTTEHKSLLHPLQTHLQLSAIEFHHTESTQRDGFPLGWLGY